MKNKILIPTLSVGFLLLTGCSSFHDKKIVADGAVPAPLPATFEPKVDLTSTTVRDHIQSWPEASRSAANVLLGRYGEPAEINATSLVWYNTAPFKRSIVYKEEVAHHFPMKHTDVLEQVVDYRIPADKVDELWRFDGSVLYDRTRGELSARCDKEEMNILALNLADKISRGNMTVADARREYSNSAALFVSGTTNIYTSGINFRMGGNTADPDSAVAPTNVPSMGRSIQAQEAKEIESADEILE